MHACQFSRPPSLLKAECGLYSCSRFWRTAKTNRTDLRCGGELLTHRSPFPLDASGAAGLEAFVLVAASGRGETSPSFGTRLKRNPTLSSHVSGHAFSYCSRLTLLSNRCTRFGGWAGVNAPDDSVWKSPQVMTHLVEQACWMEEAWTCSERNSLLSRLDEPCECLYRCHFGLKA